MIRRIFCNIPLCKKVLTLEKVKNRLAFCSLIRTFAAMNQKKRRMMAEWEPQSMVQLTWPHAGTDWAPMLPDITRVYEDMAREISQREQLLIVAPEELANRLSPLTSHLSPLTSNL